MQGLIHLCGDGQGKGNSVSLFLRVMRRPFDPILKWPMKARCKVEIINQRDSEASVLQSFSSESSNLFIRPSKDKKANIAFGATRLICCKELWHNGFVEDDVMFIRMTVKEQEMNE